MHKSMSALMEHLKEYISFGKVVLKHFDKLVSFLHFLSNDKGLKFWAYTSVIFFLYLSNPIEEMLSWMRTLENI